jgi:hypothetical protein
VALSLIHGTIYYRRACMSEENPYQASWVAPAPVRRTPSVWISVLIVIVWACVFGANLMIPLLFGWDRTSHRGTFGLVGAVATLWITSSALLLMYRKLAAPVIVGSILVAVSQVFPILQVLAGVLSFALAESMGLTEAEDLGPGRIESFSGGFLVTFGTGLLLMAGGAGCGLLIRLITPGPWWRFRAAAKESELSA